MSDTLPERREAPNALRVLGLVAVCVGVAALAAATFVLSYPGIHAIALRAGISPRLARGYPLLLDAMLVVVLAALLYLRSAGVLSKILAWLTLLALLCAAAGADALHAAKDKLPARAAEISAAVLPWVLVFLAFVLLLTMLGHARVRRLSAAQPESAAASDIMPGFRSLPGQRHENVQPESAPSEPAPSEPAPSEPAPSESVPSEPATPQPVPADSVAEEPPLAETEPPAPTGPGEDLDMPVFHRISSSPVPPDSV
jgi:hypothetical protein